MKTITDLIFESAQVTKLNGKLIEQCEYLQIDMQQYNLYYVSKSDIDKDEDLPSEVKALKINESFYQKDGNYLWIRYN